MIQAKPTPLTPYWTPLKYHEDQNALWNCDSQFAAVVAGRRSGKTELARRKIVLDLAISKPWPNPIYAYCLPTFNQAKKVAWKPLLDLIPDNWIAKNGINLSEMRIETVFGSTLYVMGMDKPERIEGISLDGVVLDESSDQKPEVFRLSVLPALTDRAGWCWRIGVPKRSGIGRIDFKAFFDKGMRGDPNISSFAWYSSTILDPSQIEVAKDSMTEEDYKEQFEAEWLEGGGAIYHAFSDENIDEGIKYDPTLPVYVGADFNVDPMCWTLSHKYGEGPEKTQIVVFDELFIKNTNTEAALSILYAKYREHVGGWKFYCDASTRQRKTNASRTDYVIIKNNTDLKDKMVFYPQRNPAVRDRFAMVNAGLKNANGEHRIHIHPKCEHLLLDLRMMAYKEGTTNPEDYTGTNIGHMSDGLGYMVCRVMPMKPEYSFAPAVYTTDRER